MKLARDVGRPFHQRACNPLQNEARGEGGPDVAAAVERMRAKFRLLLASARLPDLAWSKVTPLSGHSF